MHHEITIICDDIRHESGNKISLMGIYDDAVVLRQLPARLPKLCLFQRWAETNLKQNETIRIEIVGSPLSMTVSANCRPDPEHYDAAATKAQITLAVAPFDIIKPGVLEFVTYLRDSSEAAHRYQLEVRADPNLKLS